MIEGQNTMVSISCITYNHAPFIRKTLESFLMQKTDFEFEILIHDDASTDGTQDIIRDFQSRFPEIINPILQTENQYQKGVRGISRNFNYPRARGKYIALCEGDDYWTDEMKLQKQVDFLEANSDYVITYHDALVVDENGKVLEESKMDDAKKKDYSKDELISGSTFILTMSMLFRNLDVLKDYPKEADYIKNGDNFLTTILGMYGKGKYMPEIKPAVYRRHGAGIWSKLSDQQKTVSKIQSYYWTYHFLHRMNNRKGKNAYLNKIAQSLNKVDIDQNLIVVPKGILSKVVSFLVKTFS